jgi:RNA polymerase sigma-70 factor (ECF subfamily)
MLPEPSAASPSMLEQLLLEARGGSRESLGKLLHAFRRYLLRLGAAEIRSELQPKGGASDLVQDTFLDAQLAFHQFTGTSKEEICAWLRRIFLNNLSNFRRRYQVGLKRRVAREISLDDSRFGSNVKKNLASDNSSPASAAIRSEQSILLRTAVRELPTIHQQVIILRSRSMPFDLIGRELGCTTEAARKLWARAVKHLSSIVKQRRSSVGH